MDLRVVNECKWVISAIMHKCPGHNCLDTYCRPHCYCQMMLDEKNTKKQCICVNIINLSTKIANVY